MAHFPACSNLRCHHKGSKHNVLDPNGLQKISDRVNKGCCFGWLSTPFMGLVVAVVYIMLSYGICLLTALAAFGLGIIEPLLVLEICEA